MPGQETDSAASTRMIRALVLFAGAAGMAFLLYRPDTNVPFEIVDFSETLPILTTGEDFAQRFLGLFRYYLDHGRAAIGLSAGLAAKWTVFEWWTPGWQWTRFAVGLTIATLAWFLLRRLGASKTGATFGASLFIVSETAAHGWIRPALNEPFGMVLLLSASLLATSYQSSERPRVLAGAIAVLLASMIMVKETLVAATFFPVALALSRGADGLLAMPVRSARNSTLLLCCSVAVFLVSLPVLWAITQSAPDGYARQFGDPGEMLSNTVFGVLPAMVPFTPVSQPSGWATTVADVAWLVLLMAGLRNTSNDPAIRRHTHVLLVLALGLPLARVAVYLPWPLQFPYYSIPYSLGIVILAALGVTAHSKSGVATRFLGLSAAVFVVLYAASTSAALASRQFASRGLTDSLVTALHELERTDAADTIFLAVARGKEQAWTGLGPTLARFGDATDRPLPPIVERLCKDAGDMEATLPPRKALVSLRWQCDLKSATLTIEREARRLVLSDFGWATDTLRAGVLISGAP
jgi:hypothetical protein